VLALLEEISRLVGHSGTAVTEEVYRRQIRPVIQTGAVVMDGIFKADSALPARCRYAVDTHGPVVTQFVTQHATGPVSISWKPGLTCV
jgi:hypothetical protein